MVGCKLNKNMKILSKVSNPSCVVFAVPLYSDYYQQHDHIVQAKDAFYQTIHGSTTYLLWVLKLK